MKPTLSGPWAAMEANCRSISRPTTRALGCGTVMLSASGYNSDQVVADAGAALVHRHGWQGIRVATDCGDLFAVSWVDQPIVRVVGLDCMAV